MPPVKREKPSERNPAKDRLLALAALFPDQFGARATNADLERLLGLKRDALKEPVRRRTFSK